MQRRLVIAGTCLLTALSLQIAPNRYAHTTPDPNHLPCPADSLPCLMRYRMHEFATLTRLILQHEQNQLTTQQLHDSLQLYYYPERFAGKKLSSPELWQPGFSTIDSLFFVAYQRFYQHPTRQHLTTLLQYCIACHSVLCPGPLATLDEWRNQLNNHEPPPNH